MSDYWIVREQILEAVKKNDDYALTMLARAFPKIFADLVNQAKNAHLEKVPTRGKKRKYKQ